MRCPDNVAAITRLCDATIAILRWHDCAIPRYSDAGITRWRKIRCSISYHRHRLIASSSSYHCVIAVNLYLVIALSRYDVIVIALNGKRRRIFASYLYRPKPWCDVTIVNYVALSEFHVLYDSYKGAETAFAVVFNTVLMHPGPTTFFMQEPISCFFITTPLLCYIKLYILLKYRRY